MSSYPYTNLVFEGGGVLGIAYVGMIEVLSEKKILPNIQRVAGSSAGAITSTITSFNLAYDQIKAIADSLDYKKVPETGQLNEEEKILGAALHELNVDLDVGDINCLIRLIKRYGWYSSDYFYNWLKDVIANQFTEKKDAYTFADFQNKSIHKDGRAFKDLFITGTDISKHQVRVFSAQTSPDVEVATAVRISMSVPLFFESIPFQYPGDPEKNTFSDGGTMWNYPIEIFDQTEYGGHAEVNPNTLGGHFYTAPSTKAVSEVNSLKDYIKNLMASLLAVQGTLYKHTPDDVKRTIDIDVTGIDALNFDVEVGDKTYTTLINSGRETAEKYINNLR